MKFLLLLLLIFISGILEILANSVSGPGFPCKKNTDCNSKVCKINCCRESIQSNCKICAPFDSEIPGSCISSTLF